MQEHVDSLFFLLETLLGLAHVVIDRIVRDEGLGLELVVELGRGDERTFEGVLVDVKVLAVDV